MKNWLYLLFVALSFPVLGQNKAITIALQKATHDSIRCRILDEAFNTTTNYEEKLQYNQQLEKIVEKNKPSSNQSEAEVFLLYKFLYLNNYGYYYQNPKAPDNSSSLHYYQQSLSIAKQLQQQDKIAQAYNNIGYVNYKKNNCTEALINHQLALKLRTKIGDKEGIAQTLNNLGVVYDQLGNYPDALNYYFSSLKIREKLKDKKGIQESYNNIGNIYMYQEKLKEALKYQFLSIKIAKELGDKQSIGDAYTNIGIIYIDQKKFTEAIKSHLVSLKILEEIGDAIGVGGAYGNIGAAYMYKGDYQKALENYFKSLEIRKSLNHKAGVAYSYLGIGMTQLEMHNPKEAKKYLEKTLQISKELNIKRLIKYSYKNLTKADSALTNYKGAFENYKIYVIYRDSLTNEETERKSLQTVMQYEYDKKEALIKEETEAKVFQSKAEKKQNQIIYSSIIVFLLTILSIIVIAFYFYKKKQKTEKLLKDKELALEIADNERRRISADLHDDLGAGISSIALLSNRIQFQESMDDVRVDASYIIENTKKVSQKLTEVIWELNSEHNNLEDLLLFIQKQGNDLFKETTTHFSMLIPIEIQDIYFSSYERKQIYLSVKECFHNIIKHAVASKVSCKTKINEVLIITIKDNGIGFNVNEKINSSTGEGLNNLKYRVANLQGKVVINSSQEGTWITLEIPLNKN